MPKAAAPKRAPSSQHPLAADVSVAIRGVRKGLSQLLQDLGGGIRRPTDLKTTLGVPYTVCWQVFNIVKATDPLAVAHQIPTVGAIRKLLDAAQQSGVSRAVIDQVTESITNFNDLAKSHGGDRSAFDTMVASINGNAPEESLMAQHRRTAFRSESQLWGIQVNTFLCVLAVKKSADGAGTDELSLSVKYGVQRMRPDAPRAIYGFRHHSSEQALDASQIGALDPTASTRWGAPVLPEFSSHPLPHFATVQHNDGFFECEIEAHRIGRQGAFDIAFGDLAKSVPFSRDADGRKLLRSSFSTRTPTMLAVSELLVHRPSFGKVDPRTLVYAAVAGDMSPETVKRAPKFPGPEVQSLGTAADVVSTPDVPRYPELIRGVFERVEWDPTEFDVYRIRIEHPILHTTTQLWFEI